MPPPSGPPRHPRPVTLATGIELHLRAMRAKRCTARSLQTLEEELRRHMADWLERPLASISRHECALRHEDLSDLRGPYLANRVLHQFRAVYNTCACRFEDLPPTNPVVAVTFNRIRRRRQPIPWPELPAWRARVDALPNPVRRDLQLFLLFTGLRSLDARTVRWEHLDLEAATVHRPNPKGGEERAFTVPVPRFALDLIHRRRADNPRAFPEGDAGWLFPSRNRRGEVVHVIEPKEQRTVAGHKVSYLPSPHRLRDTFATAAHEASVHPLDLKALMNHSLPSMGDVTAGYMRPSIEHLRESVEAVATFLEERMKPPEAPAGL